MDNNNELRLLPEDQWTVCEKCQGRVPDFASMPETLRRELDSLPKSNPIEAIKVLRQAGCTFAVAKAWTHHNRKYCREACTTPCPHCGKILRTPQARQCRFCGADWH